MSHDLTLYQMAFQAEADLQSSHLERVRQAQQEHSQRSSTPLLVAWGGTLMAAVAARRSRHPRRASSALRGPRAVTGQPADGGRPLA
jgi:hypothetical protein